MPLDFYTNTADLYDAAHEAYPNAQRDWQPFAYDQFMERRAALDNALRRREEYNSARGYYDVDPLFYDYRDNTYGDEIDRIRSLQGLAYTYAPRTYVDHAGRVVKATNPLPASGYDLRDREMEADNLLRAMGLMRPLGPQSGLYGNEEDPNYRYDMRNQQFVYAPPPAVPARPVVAPSNEEDPSYYYDPVSGTMNYR